MNSHINNTIKDQIEKVRRTENCSKIAVPFVPYEGLSYARASKKVLIVGKATDGWGWKDGNWNKKSTLKDVKVHWPGWFEDLATTAESFIEKKIIPFYSGNSGYNSLFWNRTYRIVSNLLMDQPLEDYERCPDLANPMCRFSSEQLSQL